MDDQFEEIKQRAEAATPGPWSWRGNIDHADPYLSCRLPGVGVCQVMGHVAVERTKDDRAIQSYLDVLETDEDRESALDAYLRDPYGQPISDQQLCFAIDGVLKEARGLAVFEVAPAAESRDDPRVYRADVVGVRHPDAEFLAHSRADVEWLIAEVVRLRKYVEDYELDCSADVYDDEDQPAPQCVDVHLPEAVLGG